MSRLRRNNTKWINNFPRDEDECCEHLLRSFPIKWNVQNHALAIVYHFFVRKRKLGNVKILYYITRSTNQNIVINKHNKFLSGFRITLLRMSNCLTRVQSAVRKSSEDPKSQESLKAISVLPAVSARVLENEYNNFAAWVRENLHFPCIFMEAIFFFSRKQRKPWNPYFLTWCRFH